MRWFEWEIRIRYAETDQMGICYYGNYFVWFEVARTEFFRSLGFPYTAYEKKGLLLPVGEAYCKYQKPVQYDDIIIVRTNVTKIKQSSFQFSYSVIDKTTGEEVATGYTTHVFVDAALKPVRVPAEIRSAIESFNTA